MRAMGITDSRLMCTMAWEGVAYGSIISILMIIFTIVIQIPVKYFMDHGFVFINAQYSFYWPLAIGVTGSKYLAQFDSSDTSCQEGAVSRNYRGTV